MFIGYKDIYYNAKNQARTSPDIICLYCIKIFQLSYITRYFNTNISIHNSTNINKFWLNVNASFQVSICNEIINVFDLANFNVNIIQDMVEYLNKDINTIHLYNILYNSILNKNNINWKLLVKNLDSFITDNSYPDITKIKNLVYISKQYYIIIIISLV